MKKLSNPLSNATVLAALATLVALPGCGKKSPSANPATTRTAAAAEQPPAARGTKKSAKTTGSGAAGAGAKVAAPAKAPPKSSAAAAKAAPVAPKPALAPPSAKIGDYAPDFALPSVDGQTLRLSDHKGQVVVLEWFNPDCPFVKNAHTKGPLKNMAKTWQAKGVFWIAINSGAEGKQGHGRERNKRALEEYGLDHPILLDEKGVVGRKYGADHTPHMVVIDGLGKIQYMGALDNLPFGELNKPGAKPTHYTTDALEAVMRGQAAPVQQTASWGCSVKYAK